MASPLLTAFVLLQSRHASLGMAEYFACLRALSLGFGIGSRALLISMCQTMWAKSAEERMQIQEILDMTLPAALSQSDLDRIFEDYDRVEPKESAAPVQPPHPPAAHSNASGTGAPISEADGLDLSWRSGTAERGIAEPALPNIPYSPRLEFTPQPPVSRRHMIRSWRYFRRMKPVGQPTELDVDETLARFNRDGVFIEPTLRARFSNQARLILLIDSGGSMLPHRLSAQTLVESAKESGLLRMETYYFHDLPEGYLFTDMLLTEAVPFSVASERMAKASVLIFSDAGAGRGRADASRAKATAEFVQRLRVYANTVVWLNPIPQMRWRRTTASFVVRQSEIAMFELSRSGFDGAVQALRGVR